MFRETSLYSGQCKVLDELSPFRGLGSVVDVDGDDLAEEVHSRRALLPLTDP